MLFLRAYLVELHACTPEPESPRLRQWHVRRSDANSSVLLLASAGGTLQMGSDSEAASDNALNVFNPDVAPRKATS